VTNADAGEECESTAPAFVRSGPAAVPLRSRLVESVLGRDDDAAAQLQDFLKAHRRDELLAAWFGPDLDAMRGQDASALRDTDASAIRHPDASALRAHLDRDVAALDTLIGEQVDAILHHPDFQRLEASWRGVQYLLDSTNDDERIQVRLLAITWDELSRDFSRAADFDQSELFAKIYSEEYGMPGGLPYGLLLCDYAIRHRRPAGVVAKSDDIGTLNSLAQVAAASFAPCVVGGAPQLFGIETFSDLSYVQDLFSAFRAPEYARWRSFQQRDDSRFVGIVVPRVLMREPWSDAGARVDHFRYQEGRRGLDFEDWLWGNGVYAFGAVAVRAFRDWGWFADIRGTRLDQEEAGLVTGFPAPPFSTREEAAFRRPLEVEITDAKQKALDGLGFISLSPCRLTPFMAFLGTQSAHVPDEQTVAGSDAADANSRLSSMLQYMLCVSRFAHYVKVMTRDRVGAYTTAEELERLLGDWLRQYTLGNDDASFEMKARFPLSSGAVEVKDAPGKAGSYVCTMHLKPHFQIDQVVTGFRLQTEIQGLRNG
jgi:type VI secretion system protein ImpD